MEKQYNTERIFPKTYIHTYIIYYEKFIIKYIIRQKLPTKDFIPYLPVCDYGVNRAP